MLLVELVVEVVARPTGAGSLGAAGLDHEVRNHAVKFQPIVEAVAGQLLEIGDRLRHFIVMQLERISPRLVLMIVVF